MIRGTFILITEGNRYFTSTEFNGGMDLNHRGKEILKTYNSKNIKSENDFYKFIDKFNDEHFEYNDEWMYGEVIEDDNSKLFDITSYTHHSGYNYWLNISGEDIEVKASNGTIKIFNGGGAVIWYDEFVKTELNSEPIEIIPCNFRNRLTTLSSKLGWSISFDKKTSSFDKENITFLKYSPAGQDFSFSVSADDFEDLSIEILEYHDSYDVSYEAYIWLDSWGHGVNGAPYDMRDVYDDMQSCKDSIYELYESVNELHESASEL